MSGLDIPLWKQELLKRKQAKLNQKSNETASKARVSNYPSSNSSVLNRHLTDSENKPDFESVKQNASDKNNSGSLYNIKKGSLHNRNIILDESIDSSRTRLVSGKSPILDVDAAPSRLDSFEVKPSRNTGVYTGNSTISGSSNMHGMPANSRVPYGNAKESSKAVNDSNDKSRLKDLKVEHGVESEHIRPRDVKKMWQVQATKDQTPLNNHATKKLTKETSRSPTALVTNQPSTQVGSNPSVPKAYKSPYAKRAWGRPGSVSGGEFIQMNTETNEVKKSNQKLHEVKSSLSNGHVADGDAHEKGEDGVEHIQSVKSLLGLFGGKAKPSFNRKVSDNVVFGSKAKEDKDYHTSGSTQKRPGLFKHHSEPNLFHNGENHPGYFVPDSPKNSPSSPKKYPLSPRKSPSSPKKSPVAEVAAGDAILPLHHVSHGIQERLSRLRTASHSNMEEMDDYVEWQNDLNSNSETVLATPNNEPQQKDIPVNIAQNNNQPTIPKQNIQVNNTVHENGSKLDVNKYPTVGDKTQEDLSNSSKNTQKHQIQQKDSFPQKPPRLNHDIKPSQPNSFNNVRETMAQNNSEKPRLSNASNNDINSGPAVPSARVFHGSSAKKDTPNNIKEVKNESHNQSLSQQSSDRFLPETGSNLTDTNQHKSKNKYNNKQNNYAVETNQSDSSVHNDVMSTECLTEIKQNKQDLKPVIKNQEIEGKSEQKPRRKGLNIVDPLAVLQLTKDPILLKEQPPAAELGVFKESPTGKVQIIKHEPDRKNQIAQINRAWDLDNNKQTSKQNNGDMPASSVHGSPTKPTVPVTSIDEIPVSVIGDFNSNKSKSSTNNGTLSTASGNVETGLTESEGEFIPVSSIDDEVDLGPPPEIVFDKMPGNLKSSFLQNGKKRGKLTFFEHVFIHDYQSETAATSDWDFENGATFSSYTPAAVRQYGNVSKSHDVEPTPAPQPVVTPPTPPEEFRNDEPLITYDENESVDFTESSDSTAGALLF